MFTLQNKRHLFVIWFLSTRETQIGQLKRDKWIHMTIQRTRQKQTKTRKQNKRTYIWPQWTKTVLKLGFSVILLIFLSIVCQFIGEKGSWTLMEIQITAIKYYRTDSTSWWRERVDVRRYSTIKYLS